MLSPADQNLDLVNATKGVALNTGAAVDALNGLSTGLLSALERPIALDPNTAPFDAFSRLRVSSPNFLFDSQFTYDIQPLLFEPVTAEAGASIAHDATNRCATLTFSSTPTGGKAYMQSYEWIPYQPGRSQLYLISFNFNQAAANCLKFAGVGDGVNGIQLELNGSALRISRYSSTAAGNTTVAQANWNIDKFDGTGPSGVTLDVTKAQILVIDYQALYVGRIRFGFDVNGVVRYAHDSSHSNILTVPYIAIASLPIRVGMTCSGTVSTTMRFICSSAISEGGAFDYNGYLFSQEGAGTAASGAQAHILSIQPALTFNSITTRVRFALQAIDVVVTGANPIRWDLVIGQEISGTTTFNAVNSTYSAFEYNTAGTISGTATAIIAQGYASATVQAKESSGTRIAQRYPITLNAAGAVRANGRISLLGYGIGGTSAMRASMKWMEVR